MKRLSAIAFGLLCVTAGEVFAQLRVVTTSTDLASIAKEIGGAKVFVESLTAGNTDLHYVQARPDYIVKLNKADLFVSIGLELEAGWVPLLLQQSRNSNIRYGARGYCIAFAGIELLEKPTGEVNRQMGDIHPFGNPHYWADPINGIAIAKNIKESLVKIDPAGREIYEKNFNSFKNEVLKKTKELLSLMAPHRGKEVVVYHTEFVYLLRRFGLVQGMMIEELPGVAPSPAHAKKVIEYIREKKVPAILVSPWSNVRYAQKIAKESGATLLVLPIQTASVPEATTYINMIEVSVRMLHKGLSQ
ncbi:MAG: metal ABC transporter substrate-binding protein [Spirochaetes bacterium]|nr:metal ABC transporter substrate-binding protein [Spirochaetota bacterium]